MSCAWRACVAVGLVVLLAGRPTHAATAPEAGSPEDVLTRYLTAVKNERFDDAYPLVSRAMRQGRDKDSYVQESKTLMGFADVKIFDFTVGHARIDGGKALVPNILESQDRFANTLGLTEYELYTLVQEDGGWKVDSQLLLEPHEVSKWFPGTAPQSGTPPSH